MKPTQILNEILEKGRKPHPEGTIKTWNGKDYKKVDGKWIKQRKGENKGKPEDNSLDDIFIADLTEKDFYNQIKKYSQFTEKEYNNFLKKYDERHKKASIAESTPTKDEFYSALDKLDIKNNSINSWSFKPITIHKEKKDKFAISIKSHSRGSYLPDKYIRNLTKDEAYSAMKDAMKQYLSIGTFEPASVVNGELNYKDIIKIAIKKGYFIPEKVLKEYSKIK